MADQILSFAWCFGHGRMHTLWSDQEPWCLATWVRLAGATEDSAMADKERRFGNAQFLRNLPLSVQVEIQEVGR